MELINKVLDYSNIEKAYDHVVGNKGSKGVDGVTTGQLKGYMLENLGRIKQEIMDGHYQPQAVLGIEIPKTSGGTSAYLVGIPKTTKDSCCRDIGACVWRKSWRVQTLRGKDAFD